MEDTKIIDLYFARDERAVAETADKYGTPERAFATIRAEFESELKRISQTK